MVIVPPLHYWLDNNKILRSLYQDVPTVYKNMIPTIALRSKVLYNVNNLFVNMVDVSFV
jgi:hypothetical protein